MLQEIINTIKSLRINVIKEEYELQDKIATALTKAGIPYKKEYKLARRNRIDFLVDGGIGIEVKKGKPNRANVISQLYRYSESQDISSIVLVIERNMDLPAEINGKKCVSIGLNKLWGISL